MGINFHLGPSHSAFFVDVMGCILCDGRKIVLDIILALLLKNHMGGRE